MPAAEAGLRSATAHGGAYCLDQFAHGVDLGYGVFVHVGAELVFERDQQLDAFHGIETEVEFEVVARPQVILVLLGGRADDGERAHSIGMLHPLGIGGRDFGALTGAGGHLARLALSDAALDLVALELARGGAGQLRLPDVITQNAFGARKLCGKRLDVEADDFVDVDDLLLFEDVEIRHDDRVQALAEGLARTALQAHDAHLADPGRLLVVGLDLLGIDVLAGTQDNDVFLPASNEEVTALVEAAEIARVEPAITQDLSGGFGAVVVAPHDDAAPD